LNPDIGIFLPVIYAGKHLESAPVFSFPLSHMQELRRIRAFIDGIGPV